MVLTCPCATLTTYRDAFTDPTSETCCDRDKIKKDLDGGESTEPATVFDIKLIKQYLLNCPCETTTVYRNSYTYPTRGIGRMVCDRKLCAGAAKTAADLKRAPPKPSITFGLKEYKKFVDSLDFCKKQIRKIFYNCADADVCRLEARLREMEKLVGEVFNYPDENTQLKKGPRIVKTWDPFCCNVHNKDYRFYYCRLESVLRFKAVLRSRACKQDEEERRQEIEKEEQAKAMMKPHGRVIRTGITTYYHEICLPAMERAKNKSSGVTPSDRYTERRF